MGIAYFPTPYPDEDFRSTIFRYHRSVGNKEFRFTNSDLFGITNTDRNPYFPRNLNVFLDNLDGGQAFLLDGILNANTVWPIIKPFLTDSQITAIMHEVKSGTQVMKNITGRFISGFVASSIRYCPQCMVEDHQNYGECFVHRMQQLVDVSTCSKHGLNLITHCPTCQVKLASSSFHRLLETPCCPNGHPITIPPTPSAAVNVVRDKKFYSSCSHLISLSDKIERDDLLRRFHIAVANKGYVHYSGTIQKQKFLADFKEYCIKNSSHEPHLLQFRNVKRMFSNDWNLQSLKYYFTIMEFLSGSVEQFLSNDAHYAVPLPFGTGPWKCVNRICPEYDKSVIKKCTRVLNSSGNRMSGTFVCPVCGCEYARRFITYQKATGEEWPQHRFKVKLMGHMWDSMLLDLHSNGMSNGEIARTMKTDSAHVVRGLTRLGLSNVHNLFSMNNSRNMVSLKEIEAGAREVAATHIHDDQRLSYCRSRVLDVLSIDPTMSRTDLRRELPGVYTWEMKNDRTWMESVLPRSRVGAIRLDWEAIDADLVPRVQQVAQILRQDNPKIRIGKYTIINALPCLDAGRLRLGPSKVPKAWTALLACEESMEEYQIRHASSLIQELRDKGYKSITVESILSIRPSYRDCSSRVREVIADELSVYTKAQE